MEKVNSLTEILPYVRAFQGKTFVIKLGGEVCQGEALDSIAQQLSLVHHIGIKVVIVHGGGPQLSTLMERLGGNSENISKATVAGRRITDQATLDAAKMVFAGKLSTDIVAALRKHGASGIGLSGIDGGLIDAEKRPPKKVKDNGKQVEVDFQYVGDITSVKRELFTSLLDARYIPVVSSLAGSDSGQVYNINADTLAAKVAESLQAEKLIVLTNVPGILSSTDDPASVISYIDIDGIEQMINSGKINGGMLPKVEACIQALNAGVPRTHLINGLRAGSLFMELFLNEGVGTMVVKELTSI